ncbi:MAG: GNAT family N-acetyltransferase [Anaerolineae bacterium]|nr:GNAT family N-acetyltransferase [Anaerolineae bacterium]MCA9895659.1 GNAT family N-acetyltransferase [Anaerolineae bacterium]
MNDLLVKLYELPPLAPVLAGLEEHGILVRRGIAAEKHLVLAWIDRKFGPGWASETDVAYCQQPITCFVATVRQRLVGFACYDTTRKAFFGPTGVDEEMRGKGIGKAVLLACLHDMYAQGYGYGIIGAAGPVDFYKRTVGAIEIENSSPGVYFNMLTEAQDS